MLQYNPNIRLDVFELSKQYFLTRNASSFHNIKLERANQDMDLSQSIILNAKEEKFNMDDIWGQFNKNAKLNEIDPSQNQDEKPFDENIATGKRITKDVKDYVDMEMRIEDNKNKINNNNSENEILKETTNIDPVISNYLHKQFDEVNKNCFYIEPLLIPIQPIDNNYNSPDPISKFMDAL